MVRIILVMHAPLGHAFADCARHVLGAEPELVVFDVAAEDLPEDRVPQLRDLLLSDPGDETLILSDLYGATPFNIAVQALQQAMAQGHVGHLITGTNLCMVLKALTDRTEDPDLLAERVRQGALRGIVDADHACTDIPPPTRQCYAPH